MEPNPSRSEWQRLYELAAEIKRLAPWEWMGEDDLFAVQNPDTGELGFVSVMGGAGEHLAIGIYIGAEAVLGFWSMQQLPQVEMEMILAFRQLQLSFDDREYVEDEERAIMKELGLKFRGRNAWPIFRSFLPGYMPWFIDAAEAKFLIYALEQTLEIAPRVKRDPHLLETPDILTYFARVAQDDSGRSAWIDREIVIQPEQPTSLSLPMDIPLLNKVARLPRKRGFVMELDTIGIEMMMADDSGRPFLPTLLLGVDANSGMILVHEVLDPTGGPLVMLAQIPLILVQHFAKLESRPEKVHVTLEPLNGLLRTLDDEFGWKIQVKDELKMLQAAAEAIISWFGEDISNLDMDELAPSPPQSAATPRHRSSGKRSAESPTRILQLKITLDQISPPIWRRVLVPDSMTLSDLHSVIQSAMGWWDGHLHEFDVDGVHYGEPGDEFGYPIYDESTVYLAELGLGEKHRFRYAYDFGDDWQHTVLVEKILPVDDSLTYPICIKGKRACPPEDVGGTWGYAEFLAAIADPSHPEHDESIEWIGEPFDPEEFDLDEINARLADSFGS